MLFSTAKLSLPWVRNANAHCVSTAGWKKTTKPIVTLPHIPCECIYSSAQTYHSFPIEVAPGLAAAGARRPL